MFVVVVLQRQLVCSLLGVAATMETKRAPETLESGVCMTLLMGLVETTKGQAEPGDRARNRDRDRDVFSCVACDTPSHINGHCLAGQASDLARVLHSGNQL